MDFRVLGPLEARDGEQVVTLGGARQRALLAILLLHAGEVVSVDRLIDELWGDEPPATAAHTVQVFVSRLRKALEQGGFSRLRTRAPGYVIELEPEELDLARFERLVERARGEIAASPEAAAATLREALALSRGPALADFAFEPFAQAPAARLEELRLATLEERIDADLACGRHAELVGELEGLVREHPLRERLRGQLMLALYRSGRQAEALEVFQAGRRALVDELGIDPSPALQRLERAILQQDFSLELAPAAAAPEARTAVRPQRSILLAPADRPGLELLEALAEPLARSAPPHELILSLCVEPGALAESSAYLNERRAGLAAKEVAARAAAFTSRDAAADVVRVASEQDVDLLLLTIPELGAADDLPGLAATVLADAPCDVALLAPGAPPHTDPEAPVLVPFGGSDHDWAALELGAWFAGARGVALRLLGTAGVGEEARDASRLLAHAALAAQQLVGVATAPELGEPGSDGVVQAAETAGLLVMGLAETWRQAGLGDVRAAIARDARAPVLLVRRGLRPGGLAPGSSLTRYTWSLGG
jgi:DNA-binding SARP family transcriptional activator